MRISDWSSDVCSSDLKKLSAAQMDGSRRAFDPKTEQACDPFGEGIGLAEMEAAGNLKRCARRIVDHDRDDGIAIGLGNQSVEPYRTIFGPAFGPVFGDRKSVV